jgi:hypothetical protein
LFTTCTAKEATDKFNAGNSQMKNREKNKFIVNVAVANLFSNPSFQSAVVTQAVLGETCVILDRHENWLLVKQWDNYSGWVHQFYGTVSEIDYKSTHIVLDNAGNIQSLDNKKSIRNLCFGNRIKIDPLIDEPLVLLPDGQSGFTNAQLGVLEDLHNDRSGIIDLALQFLGAPYMWGGKTPWGFDCSGLVQTVFFACGINLPRDAYQQEKNLDENTIDQSELVAGDLIFFKKSEKVDHVGIFLGGSRIIHSRGWVKINSLEKARNDYIGDLKQAQYSCVSVNNLLVK